MASSTTADLRPRSVEVVLAGQSPEGGYVASPTFAPYGFSWLRDGSFIADAMSRVGEVASAERFFDWAAAIVEGGLGFDARYTLDGRQERSYWPQSQPDGWGLWLWAVRTHCERHSRPHRWREAADATAAWLEQVRYEPCVDWWEERSGLHAATLACIAAGLGDTFDRSRAEERLDASLLVLPFLGFEAVDVSPLVSPGGGVHRHADDVYYGGGEWLLLTAFLGLAEPERARDCADWIAAHATPAGELPEQVQDHLLAPDQYEPWVQKWGPPACPLLWSHAMFLTLTSELDGLMPARLQLVARTGHPDFLDLPWSEPLAEWDSDRLVEVQRGIHRHVVRFVQYDGKLYALKELPEHLARREYVLLRSLAAEEMPVVEAVGVVTDRGDDLESVLITRHLDYSLPFRTLFARGGMPDPRGRLLDAGAELLVRLHLAGFFWGDYSLSNTLFRRDAGGLAAYLVDAETGELHSGFAGLSDGQRRHDLQIAEENVMGELLDLEAELDRPDELKPEETAAELVARYESLWDELTREETFDDETRFLIDERLRRLNELGFDVEELELVAAGDGEYRLRFDPRVVEPGHHRRRLHALTGLNAQENQARRLLNDLARFRAELDRESKQPVPETVAVHKWLSEVFEPAIAAVPGELWGKRHPAEVFHEALEHRWFLSQQAGEDVGLQAAIKDYVDNVLRHAPDERAILEPTQPALDDDAS